MSSANPPPPLPPIIRVCRKRSADPQTALVVQFKRQRADPLLFSLFSTSEQSTINAHSHVVDFTQQPPITVAANEANSSNQSGENVENALSFAADAVNEVGGAPSSSQSRRRPADDDVITLNGVALQASQAGPADLVFDFYRISSTVPNDIDLNAFGTGDLDIRFATKEDRELLFDNCDSESDACDDDADSNAENDWRNDYPDESDGDEYGEYSDEDEDGGCGRRRHYGGLHDDSLGNRFRSLDLHEQYDSDEEEENY